MQLFLLGALARISNYQIPTFDDSNWSTVLFLTPLGILTNELFPSAITSFYRDLINGSLDILNLQMSAVWMTLIWAGLLMNGFQLAHQLNQTSRSLTIQQKDQNQSKTCYAVMSV